MQGEIHCALGLNFFLFRNLQTKIRLSKLQKFIPSQICKSAVVLVLHLENKEMEAFFRTIAPWPIPRRQSLSNCNYNGADHSPRLFQVKNDQLAIDFELFHRAFANPCTNQRRSQRGVRLNAQLIVRCLIAIYCVRWHCTGNFKGLSQNGRQADFSINLCASLYNDDLSNEPYYGQIHLAG